MTKPLNQTRLLAAMGKLQKRRAQVQAPAMKGVTQTPSLLERRQMDPLYHSAFDIRDDVLVVGFEVEQPENGTLRREILHVVSVPGAVFPFEGSQARGGGKVVRVLDAHGALPLIDVEIRGATLTAFLKKPVALPGRQLYDRLMTKLHKHVDFDHDGKYVIVVAWGVMTYVYPLFSSLPYLSFLGAKGTGKSQSLDLLAQLVRSGYKSHATAAVIGDLIQSRRPTLLLDQADNLTPEHVDLLADGYRAGARRAIVDMDHRGQPREFEIFGPKVFAGTTFLDEDLADRAILITTSPAARPVEPIAPGDEDATELREESYKWAWLNFYKLQALPPFSDPAWHGLAPYRSRQRDLWLPIEVMMEALNVPEVDRKAAREYYARSQTSTKAELPEHHSHLLRVLVQVVGGQETAEVTSTVLLERISPSDETAFEDPDRWTPQRLGRALKSLNVLLANQRTNDHKERRYIIDGEAVRSTAKRYSLTD